MTFTTLSRFALLTACCAFGVAVSGCGKAGPEAPAKGASGAEASKLAQYEVPARGTDTCSVTCGRHSDEQTTRAHRDWFKSDDEYNKNVEVTNARAKTFEKECQARCAKLLAGGGLGKELVESIATRCADKKGLDHAGCIGKLNQEMREKQADSPPEW